MEGGANRRGPGSQHTNPLTPGDCPLNEPTADPVAPMAHFRLKEGEVATYAHHNAILERVEATRNRLGLGPSGLAKLEEGEAFLGDHYNALAAELEAIADRVGATERAKPEKPGVSAAKED